MKPHKHAEVLRAIADGRDVQYLTPNGEKWIDLLDMNLEPDPLTCPSYSWRIKPEPKPDVVRYVVADSFDESYMYSVPQKDDGGIGPLYRQVKLTFDGETGKLKNAEVIK